MKRELPNRPNLEHLKSQAKELLEAFRRREVSAFHRIREAVPGFAQASDDELARSQFALHDAQSAIAREYGFPSFAKLRAHVLVAAQPYPAELVARFAGKLTPDVEAALRDVWTKRDVEALDALPTPAELPALAVRNAVVSPGALVPLAIGRPASLLSLEAVVKSEPALVALFSQRNESDEHPTAEDLYAAGCVAVVRRFQPLEQGGAWVVLEGVRWITLLGLVATEPFLVARIEATELDEGDAAEVESLDAELRALARKVASKLPEKDAALAMIEQIEDAGRLSDLVVANLHCSVAEKAAYASELTLAARLRTSIRFVERELSFVTGGGDGGAARSR